MPQPRSPSRAGAKLGFKRKYSDMSSWHLFFSRLHLHLKFKETDKWLRFLLVVCWSSRIMCILITPAVKISSPQITAGADIINAQFSGCFRNHFQSQALPQASPERPREAGRPGYWRPLVSEEEALGTSARSDHFWLCPCIQNMEIADTIFQIARRIGKASNGMLKIT